MEKKKKYQLKASVFVRAAKELEGLIHQLCSHAQNAREEEW